MARDFALHLSQNTYLAAEGIKVSRNSMAKFIKRFYITGRLHQLFFVAICNAKGTIAHQSCSGRKSIVTSEICKVMDEEIRHDDETTAS